MPNNTLENWERKLRTALDKADATLEAQFATSFTRRPNRPPHGSTGNPKYDGLFSLDAKFTLGLVNAAGPSYIVDLRTATLQFVPQYVHAEMLSVAKSALQTALLEVFPDRILKVEIEGNKLRITGNLNFT